MSPLTIASTVFGLLQSSSTASQTGATGLKSEQTNSDFSSSLTLRLAQLQAQSDNLLFGSTSNSGQTSSAVDLLSGILGSSSPSSDPLALLGNSSTGQGLSAGGYQLSLFDPGSAYQMMSLINTQNANYKAQFSELSEMKTAVAGLEKAAETLSGVNDAMDDASIAAELQAFATKYNEWINRFDATVKSDGVLAGTQAAEISLYELEQSVENPFNGAKDGFHGLRDLGFSIDENTNLATVDSGVLNSVLASNKDGAVSTLQQFSTNFAKAAELLNSSDNFIPNRLDNLDRVIDYIADNESSLQAEFGLGAPARPSAKAAQALAAYHQTVTA